VVQLVITAQFTYSVFFQSYQKEHPVFEQCIKTIKNEVSGSTYQLEQTHKQYLQKNKYILEEIEANRYKDNILLEMNTSFKM